MRRILVVIDMQNDFVTGSLGTPEAQAMVPLAVEKIKECKENGYEIIFTKDTHYKDYFMTLEGKYLPIEHCRVYTNGWEIIDELKSGEKLTTIQKNTFGFDNWYNLISDPIFDQDIQFELIGLCTDICVVSNALILRAQFPDSVIIVHADCCAGTTPEKHAAALEVMKSCQIIIKGE